MVSLQHSTSLRTDTTFVLEIQTSLYHVDSLVQVLFFRKRTKIPVSDFLQLALIQVLAENYSLQWMSLKKYQTIPSTEIAASVAYLLR